MTERKFTENCFHAAVPLIQNSNGEILLTLRDDAPVWQTAGSAALDPVELETNDYAAAAYRGIEYKTGIAPAAYEHTLGAPVQFQLINPQNEVMEDSKVYVTNVGNTLPVVKLGVTHQFFAPDALPKNTFSFQKEMIAKLFGADTAITAVEASYSGDDYDCLIGLPAEEITGLDAWNTHEKVQAKRADGKLQRDPFPPQIK